MKKVAEYITEKEEKEFCANCCEICTRQCVIWRKAEMRESEDRKACIK